MRSKIQQKRNSNKFIWKYLFRGKDLVYKIINKADGIIDKSLFRFSEVDYTDLTLCKQIKKYSFVFICQKGKLEIGALLLAASLKRFLKCEYELIAVIPKPADIMGTPHEVTIKLLKEMGVRIEYIYNKIVSRKRQNIYHLITNKIYCLRVPTSSDKLIFMDSDILCFRDFYGDQRFNLPINAKKVGLGGTIPYKGKWNKFYKALNIDMPNIRIRVEYPAGFNYVPPYFSSSFVAVRADIASKLSDQWFSCWNSIYKKGLVNSQPYFIDQIALALSVAKMNVPYELIDRDWLYSIFYNYDKLESLKNSPEMTKLVKSFISEYPELSILMRDNSNWEFLLS